MLKYYLITLTLVLSPKPTILAKRTPKKSSYTLQAKKKPLLQSNWYIFLPISIGLLYVIYSTMGTKETKIHTHQNHVIDKNKPILLLSANVFYTRQWKEPTPQNTMQALQKIIKKKKKYSRLIFAFQEAFGYEGKELSKLLKNQNFWTSHIQAGCFFAVFPSQDITQKKAIHYSVEQKVENDYPKGRSFVGIDIEGIGTFANVHLTGGRYEDKYYEHDSVRSLPKKQIIEVIKKYDPIVIMGDLNADKKYTDVYLKQTPYWNEKAQNDKQQTKLKNYLMNRHRILEEKGYKTLHTIKRTSRFGGKPDFIYYQPNKVTLKNEKKIDTIKNRISDHDFIYAELYPKT